MDLEVIVVNEINHTEKEKYYMISLICGISKARKQIKHKTHIDPENILMVVRGEDGVGEMREPFLFYFLLFCYLFFVLFYISCLVFVFFKINEIDNNKQMMKKDSYDLL